MAQHADALPPVQLIDGFLVYLELVLQQLARLLVVQLAQVGAGAGDGGGVGLAEEAVHGILAHALCVLQVRHRHAAPARITDACMN